MEQNKLALLMPEYMRRFRCVGTECEFSCCKGGWRIYVDKETYGRYLACDNGTLREKFKDHIDVYPGATSDAEFAFIRMAGSLCPFLTDADLCEIQSELGESYLSRACAQYPRVTNQIGHANFEISASVSCPEVGRLGLLNPGGMALVDTTIDADEAGGAILNHLVSSPDPVFWEIRIFCLQLLKSRTLQIWERLIIMGFFLQKAAEFQNAGKWDGILDLIAEYNRMLESGTVTDQLRKIPMIDGVRLEILRELTNIRLKTGVINKLFAQCFSAFLKGIGYQHGNITITEVMTGYRSAETTYFRPFFQAHDYVFENYLVNYAFNNVFPFKSAVFFQEYLQLVLRYALVRMYLVGMAGYYREAIKLDHLIELICSFTRQIDHNPDIVKQMGSFMEKKGYTGMAHMAILIKD